MSLKPKGIKLNIKVHSKGAAIVVGTDNPYIKAAVQAMHDVFKKDTVYIRSGGSIPIVGDFANELKIPSVMMGMGLPDDNLHAPNEKFHIPNFYRGIESLILYFNGPQFFDKVFRLDSLRSHSASTHLT
jgi:acetylornithine deacetylase/succinyl-diaminopimelate desuccinylase-like protein